MRQQTIELVQASLFDLVNQKNGVGSRAKIRKMEVAGSVGTVPGVRGSAAWFLGYSPASKPRHAICVVVENGSTGGKVAAPLAGMILAECSALPDPEKVRPRRFSPSAGHGEKIELIEQD